MKTSLSEQVGNSPLIWICFAFLGGIVMGSWVNQPTQIWLGLAFAVLLISIPLRLLRRQWRLAFLLLPGFIFLGGARYQMIQPPAAPAVNEIAYYNELPSKAYVTGILVEPPDIRDTYMNLRIEVHKVDTGSGDMEVHGTILVRVENEYEVAYGDELRVRGYLKTPPENEEFSYREYLAMQGIPSIMRVNTVTVLFNPAPDPFWALMYRFKEGMVKRIYRLFPDPEASLLAGILLGVESNLPKGVEQAFKNTGTAHIIAISGFNIAIIAGIFVTLFSRFFGKNLGAVLAIISIVGYTLLVGASASVVRAAIMGTLSIIAAQFGRRNLALTSLGLAALLMGLYNPFILWDIGFQLSFFATLGLVLYAQPMQEAVAGFLKRFIPSPSVEQFIGPFSDYFLLTFAAQLTTLPITIYHFGRLSLVSFFANPVVLPPQPLVMILSGLALVFSRVYMPLGQLIAWVAWPFASYTIRMVEFFDKIPGGVLVLGEFSLMATALFYVFLFGFTLAWSRVRGYFVPMTLLTLVASFSFLTWRSVLSLPDERLHVTFLNVGSADGVLIKTPSGKYILVNGGESPSALADQIGRRIPPFNRGLDYLVVASTQENQLAALPRVLDQYPPQAVLWTGNPEASFSSQRLSEWLTVNDIPRETALAGTVFDLGDSAELHVLSVSPRGAILRIQMGSFRVILPIGVDYDAFTELENGKGFGPVTALLLAESGYGPSNPPEWLSNLQPELFILSVEAGDPDGLPTPEMIKALKEAGVNIARTDANGWIDLTTDGQQVWITTENK